MQAAPSSSLLSPATSMPTSSTTPASPTSMPTSRCRVTRSSGSTNSVRAATSNGNEAIRIAVTDDDTWTSPKEISGNGMQTSDRAKAATQGSLRGTPRSARECAAIGSRSAAPSATRAQATKIGGTPWSTAILMNRYGMPQIADIAANRAQARGVMWWCGSGPAPRELPGQRQHTGRGGSLDQVAGDEVDEPVGERPAERLVPRHGQPWHADRVDQGGAHEEQRQRGERAAVVAVLGELAHDPAGGQEADQVTAGGAGDHVDAMVAVGEHRHADHADEDVQDHRGRAAVGAERGAGEQDCEGLAGHRH